MFLAIGRTRARRLPRAPQHAYLVRAIDAPAPDALPPRTEVILQRGPFELEDEIVADAVARHRRAGEQELRRRCDLRQDRRGARSSACRWSWSRRPAVAAPATCRSDVASALDWLHALLPAAHGARPPSAACRPTATVRRARSAALRSSRSSTSVRMSAAHACRLAERRHLQRARRGVPAARTNSTTVVSALRTARSRSNARAS